MEVLKMSEKENEEEKVVAKKKGRIFGDPLVEID